MRLESPAGSSSDESVGSASQFLERLVRSGDVRSTLSDAYFDALRREVRNREGGRWVASVTRVKRRAI